MSYSRLVTSSWAWSWPRYWSRRWTCNFQSGAHDNCTCDLYYLKPDEEMQDYIASPGWHKFVSIDLLTLTQAASSQKIVSSKPWPLNSSASMPRDDKHDYRTNVDNLPLDCHFTTNFVETIILCHKQTAVCCSWSQHGEVILRQML